MTASSPTHHANGIHKPPLPHAGEGWGEAEAEGDPLASGPLASGYNVYCFPLTAALRHPVFPDLCKAERDFILSPVGERK